MKTIGKSTLAASAIAIFFASPALSADLARNVVDPTSVASEQPSPMWSGIWFGAVGGYQFSNSEKSASFDYFGNDGKRLFGSNGASTDGLGSEGLFGEVQLGYDQQIGRFIVGAFGGLNISDGEHTQTASFFDGDEETGKTTLAFEQEWGGVLGVRAGMLKSQNSLFYVAGGWAFGEMGDLKSDGKAIFENQETDLNGWFAEIGMETRVSNNIYLTVAGRYTDYGSLDLSSGSGDCVTSLCETKSHSLELDTDTLGVMAGLKFKLNGGLGF